MPFCLEVISGLARVAGSAELFGKSIASAASDGYRGVYIGLARGRTSWLHASYALKRVQIAGNCPQHIHSLSPGPDSGMGVYPQELAAREFTIAVTVISGYLKVARVGAAQSVYGLGFANFSGSRMSTYDMRNERTPGYRGACAPTRPVAHPRA